MNKGTTDVTFIIPTSRTASPWNILASLEDAISVDRVGVNGSGGIYGKRSQLFVVFTFAGWNINAELRPQLTTGRERHRNQSYLAEREQNTVTHE